MCGASSWSCQGRRCTRCKRDLSPCAFNRSPAGTLRKHCRDCNAKNKTYRETSPVYVAYSATDDRKAMNSANSARYRASPKGKAYIKKWNKTEKGLANKKKCRDNENERVRNDTGRRLEKRLHHRFWSMMKGQRMNSVTMWENTEFADADLMTHLEPLLVGEMTLDNYGPLWHIEHAIPCVAYDHSNPQDVLRCWSRANIRPLLGLENRKKRCKIIPSLCLAVGADYWPVAWGGRGPWAA